MLFSLLSQRTGDGRVLASVYQQCGQCGPIQEGSSLGRRLTHTCGFDDLSFICNCSQSTAATRIVCIFLIHFFFNIYHLNKLKRKKND